MNVINIRGTTGSGKTTTMREFIKQHDFSQALTLSKGVVGHYSRDYAVIGPYKEGSNFGGVDAIAKIEYVAPAIFKALQQRPTVLFEGLLISHSYDRWLEFSKELMVIQKTLGEEINGMIWAFIVPKFSENVRRLRKRNNIQGVSLTETKGEKYLSNFIARYKSILRIKRKAKLDAGFGNLTIRELDPYQPNKDLEKLLTSAIITSNNKLMPKVRSKFF